MRSESKRIALKEDADKTKAHHHYDLDEFGTILKILAYVLLGHSAPSTETTQVSALGLLFPMELIASNINGPVIVPLAKVHVCPTSVIVQ